MEIRHLRYFVAMAEAGSLMQASERLHVAQPALSVHLANLEAELGVKLVARSNRGIVLTEEGRELYERAIVILRHHAEAIEALRIRTVKPIGSVSVGIPSTLSAQIAPPLFSALRSELPEVNLNLLESSTAALYEWLQNGKIDFAVLFSLPEHVGLDVTPLYMEDFYLLGPPQESSQSPGDIQFSDIFDYPLVLPRQTSSWRRVLDQAAKDIGKSFSCHFETDSMSAMKALAMTGQSYSILPLSCIVGDMREGKLHGRKIIDPHIRGLLSIANVESVELSLAHREVRKLIVRIARDFEAGSDGEEPFYSRQVLPGSLFGSSGSGRGPARPAP
jgi:LysR family nitrogen assimilation transcriptional regulator